MNGFSPEYSEDFAPESFIDSDARKSSFSLAKVLNVDNTPSLKHYKKPLVVGHRGAVYYELENTLAGFNKCAEMGCQVVELDVFLLKCNTLVVFHGGGSDEDPGQLLDYCGVYGNILDYTAQEAREMLKFNVESEEFPCPKENISGRNAFIPTLQEVLLDAKQSGLILKLELKGAGTEIPVLQLVEQMDMVHQCHFSSFDHSKIATIRKLRPQTFPDGTHVYKTAALFKCNVPSNFIELSLQAGASEVHLKYDTCTVDRVKAIHDNGMASMVWFRGPKGMNEDVTEKYYDVGNEDESMFMTVMRTGVMSLCVNKPDVLLNLLESY